MKQETGRSTVSGSHARTKGNLAVLVISPYFEERAFLVRALRGLGCVLHSAQTLVESLHLLSSRQLAAVLCSETLLDGDWKCILANLTRSSSKAKLIVTSRRADDTLWAEVLNHGGYDVLAKPFDAAEVCRAIESACEDSQTWGAGPGYDASHHSANLESPAQETRR